MSREVNADQLNIETFQKELASLGNAVNNARLASHEITDMNPDQLHPSGHIKLVAPEVYAEFKALQASADKNAPVTNTSTSTEAV